MIELTLREWIGVYIVDMTDFKKVEADAKAKAKVNSTIICKDVPNMFQPSLQQKNCPWGSSFIICNSCQRRLAAGFAGQLDIANTDFPKSLMNALKKMTR